MPNLADDLFPEPESLHPVPEEQQPIREYEALRDSGFFRWATLDISIYVRRLGWVWFWAALVAAPVAASCFPPEQQLGHMLVSVAEFGVFFVLLATIRQFLGWSYVKRRLSQESIVYEESGWYDGEIWDKPEDELAKDRLVVDYQVKPVMVRLNRTFGVIAAMVACGTVVWPFV
ncbi:MAG: CGLD27 family protein [Cyanobacteria bacterium P01_E01_bin.34]